MAVQKRGHIKIARKAFAEDKWWLEKRVFSKWEAWEDMIQLAQHETREFVSNKYGTIRLERGEFVLSLRRMAGRWGWGVQSTRSFTRSATFRTRLATQRETQAGTVYRIVNYDLYQSTEEKPTQPATQQITHDQHTSNTPVTQEQALKQLTTTTSASHEAAHGTANGTKPSAPKPPSWAAEGAGIWNDRVGPITIPKFGRIMKPMVDKHGWPESKAAEICYIELKEGQARQLQWLVDESVTWVRLGKQQTIDPKTGAFTERGELARRAAQRTA